jgi:hypothetical protein
MDGRTSLTSRCNGWPARGSSSLQSERRRPALVTLGVINQACGESHAPRNPGCPAGRWRCDAGDSYLRGRGRDAWMPPAGEAGTFMGARTGRGYRGTSVGAQGIRRNSTGCNQRWFPSMTSAEQDRPSSLLSLFGMPLGFSGLAGMWGAVRESIRPELASGRFSLSALSSGSSTSTLRRHSSPATRENRRSLLERYQHDIS